MTYLRRRTPTQSPHLMQKQSTDYMTGDYFEVNAGPLNSALHDITKSIRHHASVLSKVEGLANEYRQIKKDLHLIRLDLSSQESLQILNNENASISRELPNPVLSAKMVMLTRATAAIRASIISTV